MKFHSIMKTLKGKGVTINQNQKKMCSVCRIHNEEEGRLHYECKECDVGLTRVSNCRPQNY